MSKAPPKRREEIETDRLWLHCQCGKVEKLWVDPNAPVLSIAKAHGWRFVLTDWVCPKCVEDAND